jgi:hypothetical protein
MPCRSPEFRVAFFENPNYNKLELPDLKFRVILNVQSELWYHRLELNGGPSTWNRFVQLANICFRPSLTDRPIGELARLHRDGSMDDYTKRFLVLSCRDPSIKD